MTTVYYIAVIPPMVPQNRSPGPSTAIFLAISCPFCHRWSPVQQKFEQSLALCLLRSQLPIMVSMAPKIVEDRKILGDHLWQGGPSVVAIIGSRGPSTVTKIAIDGPRGPLAAGDQLQCDITPKCIASYNYVWTIRRHKLLLFMHITLVI